VGEPLSRVLWTVSWIYLAVYFSRPFGTGWCFWTAPGGCEVLCFIKTIKFQYFPPPCRSVRKIVRDKRDKRDKRGKSPCKPPERFGAVKCEWRHTA
jgi:hypothetical protein